MTNDTTPTPVGAPDTLTATAPERIWLQIDTHGDPNDRDEPFPSDEQAISRTHDLAADGGRWPSDWIAAYRRGWADAASAPKAAPAPAAVAGPLNELEELDLLNKLIHLGARAASAHAKSNSDDGHAGTAAYVEWRELRADMGELIRKAYAAPPEREPHPPHRDCGCAECAPSFEP